MKSKKSKKNNNLRLFIICCEVFVLVLAVGLGYVYYQVDVQRRVSNELKRAGITEELLAGKNVVSRLPITILLIMKVVMGKC